MLNAIWLFERPLLYRMTKTIPSNNNNSYNIYRALNTTVSKRYNQIDKIDGFK